MSAICSGNRRRLPARLPQRRARPGVHPPAGRGRLARTADESAAPAPGGPCRKRPFALRHKLAPVRPGSRPGQRLRCATGRVRPDRPAPGHSADAASAAVRFDRRHQFGQVPLQTQPLLPRRRDTAGEHHQHADQPGEEQNDDGRTPRHTDADRAQRERRRERLPAPVDGGSVITTRPGSTAPTGGHARAAAHVTESSPRLASCLRAPLSGLTRVAARRMCQHERGKAYRRQKGARGQDTSVAVIKLRNPARLNEETSACHVTVAHSAASGLDDESPATVPCHGDSQPGRPPQPAT
jgi:hypothetical protein